MHILIPITLVLLRGAMIYYIMSIDTVPPLDGLIFYGSSSKDTVFNINKLKRSYLIQSETIETPNVYHHIKKEGYYTFLLLVNNPPGHKGVIVFRPNMLRHAPSNRLYESKYVTGFDGPDSIKEEIELSSKTAVAEYSALLILQIGEFKDEDLKEKIADLKKGFENDAAKKVLIQSLGTVVAKTDIKTGTTLEMACTYLVYGRAAAADLYKVQINNFCTVKFGEVDVWKNVKRLTSDQVQSEPSITVNGPARYSYFVQIVDVTLDKIIQSRYNVSNTNGGDVLFKYKPSNREGKDTHVCTIIFFEEILYDVKGSNPVEYALGLTQFHRMDYLIHFTKPIKIKTY